MCTWGAIALNDEVTQPPNPRLEHLLGASGPTEIVVRPRTKVEPEMLQAPQEPLTPAARPLSAGQLRRVPLPLDPEKDPWERQGRESYPAWEAFRMYRDGGAKRSLDKVARRSGKDPTLIARWSRRHRWVERVVAYEAELDRVARREIVEAHQRATRQRLTTGTGMIARAGREIAAKDPGRMSVFEAARVAEVGRGLVDVGGGRAGGEAPLISIERAIFANASAEDDPRTATD
jgi:hypothetical protein